MNMRKIFLSALATVTLGCGGGDSEDTQIADAWALFVAGQYSAAHSSFTLAIRDHRAEALVGLGWTTLKMDSLPQSNGYFLRTEADTLLHGYAGWAIVGWLNGDHANSAAHAQFVLDRLPEFVFEFDNGVTYRTMLLTQGYDYWHLGDFPACLSRVQLLDTGFASTTDPAALLTKLDALRAAQ